MLSYIGRFTAINPLRLDGIFFFSISVFEIVAGPFVAIAAALSHVLVVAAVGDPHDRPPESFRRRPRASVPEDSLPDCPAMP